MESKLPSWRVGALVLVIVVLAVGATVLQKREKSSLEGLTVKGSERSEIDTDGDGLADWEEDLWITDTHNADTDGDGMSDGEELRNNRHPRIAAPNDEIDEGYIEALYALETSVPEGRTVSAYQTLIEDRVYPALVAAAAQKREGQELSDEELVAILDPLAEEGQKTITFYTKNDLKITTTVSSEAYLEELLNELAKFAQKEINASPPLEIIADKLANPDASTSLSSAIKLYSDFLKAMLAMDVPPALSDSHLRLVNAYASLQASLQSIEASGYDPTVVLVETQRYDTAATSVGELVFNIVSNVSL